MSNYYYLISSFYDLLIDDTKKLANMNAVIELCSEELTSKDFGNLKKIFLFNDICNVVNFKKDGDLYLTPAYYSKEEFIEGLKDTDQFFPFMARYFFAKKNEKRVFPELSEIDELVLLFYEELDNLENKFIKDYYLFELDLQNITTAISLKKCNLPLGNKIIPYGDNFEKILKNNSRDFGLPGDVSYIEQLNETYDTNDLLKIERVIEDIRWDWLDERAEDTLFSEKNVFAYVIKLKSVERWYNMTEKLGQEMMQKLISKIKSNIKFSDEFLTIGGKR